MRQMLTTVILTTHASNSKLLLAQSHPGNLPAVLVDIHVSHPAGALRHPAEDRSGAPRGGAWGAPRMTWRGWSGSSDRRPGRTRRIGLPLGGDSDREGRASLSNRCSRVAKGIAFDFAEKNISHCKNQDNKSVRMAAKDYSPWEEQRRSYDDLQNCTEEEAAEAVSHLLPEEVKGELSELCVWADQIRHWYKYRWTSSLHFIFTPDNKCSFDYARDFVSSHPMFDYDLMFCIWVLQLDVLDFDTIP
ncbi:endonuclease 1-like [Senna tora]|uniref:Aspergillus nuclease S1 n=1 Tax=Senna tora TaxID=362788 RepID=A0A834XI40_9FABA|nr:endonuclease 1-like [Senna tora]